MKVAVLASPGQSTDIYVNRLLREGFDDLLILVDPPQSKRANTTS